ncbi:ATP-binding protein [Sphingosinicella sp. CPCC 101087]|uniref:PAS domain-containing sensor histidine kinase n=1 Tax=Sphingosinicella sp. CPCC 101087 TaxID=2497754 RepID=UPI00101D1011|nr:ATP-binding protein [Sphingosinicella sp. CPCC 101087]
MDGPSWSQGAGILDLVHDSIIVRDLDDRILQWNAAAEALYGWPRREAVGRNLHDLLHCRDPERLKVMEAGLHAHGAWEGEITRTTRDGNPVRIDVRWSLQRGHDHSGPCVVETGRDLTARRAAEEAAQLTEYRYRNLFQAMSVAFFEVDFAGVGPLLLPLRDAGADLRSHLAGNPDLVREAMRRSRVLDVNAKALSLFGAASPEEMIGGDVDRYWPDSSLPVFAEALVETFEKRPHMMTETRLRDLAGSELDVLFTVSWSPESRRSGVLLIGVIDISDRLRAERMLRQVQSDFAHAARVATLGELTASIAHEVNQPLAAIATNGEASLRWLARPEPELEEVRRLAGRMVADARRAADIIARIRGMASRASPEPVAVAVDDLVTETLAFLDRELRIREVEAEVHVDPHLPLVSGDRTQIQQVLVNLIVNALQALDQVPARDRRLALRLHAADQAVRVEVEDNGPGIPEGETTRLFDSFFTTKPAGLGIGLSLCRSIVEAHGGRIAHETAGRGARFVFTLPAAVGAEPFETHPARPEMSTHTKV